jgi:predicted nucleic acid-binding protein
MNDAKVFLDTNVLVYAQDEDAGTKRARARALISEVAEAGSGVISTQVLQEFHVVATRKLRIAPLQSKAVLQSFRLFEIVHISPRLVDDAIDRSVLAMLPFWDALIVAAAKSAGCTTLYSEDLNPGQQIAGIRVSNPFR